MYIGLEDSICVDAAIPSSMVTLVSSLTSFSISSFNCIDIAFISSSLDLVDGGVERYVSYLWFIQNYKRFDLFQKLPVHYLINSTENYPFNP